MDARVFEGDVWYPWRKDWRVREWRLPRRYREAEARCRTGGRVREDHRRYLRADGPGTEVPHRPKAARSVGRPRRRVPANPVCSRRGRRQEHLDGYDRKPYEDALRHGG